MTRLFDDALSGTTVLSIEMLESWTAPRRMRSPTAIADPAAPVQAAIPHAASSARTWRSCARSKLHEPTQPLASSSRHPSSGA
eukprot:1370713-Pyramimonas_sp.AAC.1